MRADKIIKMVPARNDGEACKEKHLVGYPPFHFQLPLLGQTWMEDGDYGGSENLDVSSQL